MGWTEDAAEVDGLEGKGDVEGVVAQAVAFDTGSASAASTSLKLSATASLILGIDSAASGEAVPIGSTRTRDGGRLTAVA